MKNLLLAVALIISLSLSANELQWVDEQIQAIKPPRSGISKSKVNSIKDPFIFLKKEKKVKEGKTARNTTNNTKKVVSATSKNSISKKVTSFSLDAIINKSALINGKWYKINTKVGKYTLSSVDKTSVILSYEKKQLLLSTATQNKKLKFNNN